MSKYVEMTGNCPKCGESITLVFTKKQIKSICKRMKLPPVQATKLDEEERLKEYVKMVKK